MSYHDPLENTIAREARRDRGRKLSKAVVDGWQWARAGGAESDCPYHETDGGLYTAWLAGFRDGVKNYSLNEEWTR